MANKPHPARPVKRDGYWCLLRRVPRAYAHFEKRTFVSISTSIRVADDPRAIAAQAKVLQLDAQLHATWQAAAHGDDPKLAKITLAATRRAQAINMPLISFDQAADLPLPDIFQRLMSAVDGLSPAALLAAPSPDNLGKAQIAVGVPPSATTKPTISKPIHVLKASQMLAEVERITATSLQRKSADQMRKWRQPRQSLLDLFISIIGEDPLVADINTTHSHAFRAHFQERILNEEIQINSANRRMKHVAGMYSKLRSFHQIDQRNPFEAIHFPDGEDKKREAYSTDFIQNRFLADGIFDDLNEEARHYIFLMIETGIRPSEACGLDKKTIHLHADIPHVSVTTENRDTKTKGSIRQIPLLGVALDAMKRHPNGFSRYFDNPNSLTTLIGQALKARNLKPTPYHTLYSLRHSLMDRLRNVDAPSTVQEDLAGHKHMYGEGTDLLIRHKWLSKITLKPPGRL